MTKEGVRRAVRAREEPLRYLRTRCLDGIEDEEELEERLTECTERKTNTNALALRYAGDVTPKGDRWEICEKVLARYDVKQRLARGWANGSEAASVDSSSYRIKGLYSPRVTRSLCSTAACHRFARCSTTLQSGA